MPASRNAGLRKKAQPRSPNIAEIPKEGRSFVRKHGWVQTVLLVIGVITVLAVLGALFVAAGTAPEAIYTDTQVPPVESALFATSLSHLVNAPLDEGGTVAILNNGDEFLPALIEAIDSAKRTINFSVYIWSDGQVSDAVLKALIRARTRNVAVRILLDDFGSKEIPFWKFSDLKRAGGRVERFRTIQFGKLTRLHRRDHRRSIVIDGKTGFTGGMAVADTWLGHAEDPTHWRDMMFRVTGPLATSLQAAFVSSWASSSGEILTGPDMYPHAEKPVGGVKRFIHLVNSPAADVYSMAEFFLVPILAARESIFIVTPYFIPDVHLQSALVQKAKQGVEVTLLLPGRHIDNRLVWLSSQANYEELLNAGVKIYQYAPTFIHSKFMVVDRKWSVIGSANLDYRSRQLDEENAIGILDIELANRLVGIFHGDLEHAEEIKLEEWRHRSVLLKMVQHLAQVLNKQS
jgi:cardiolipin synthase A/B